ncbi:TPM domain-containing protein [Rhizobacter sp. J219]|uniref:TPM domain-containing protein n=1 Tax=Rhizobacter sp. J219 TaxID=2898430 RepID=UPI0021519103|nr:TPM domain-containing protein [Rhizobacter sp. J219]MCR5884317.1 TPM domain-containing protein [Rhizobacter sp. J219]
MNRWLRILKHRWLDESDARRALAAEALRRLQARVAASEKRHSGEIRICVEAGLPMSYLWRNATPRERAVTMFGKLRVWDTEYNNGVLIYLLLAEHAIEIVADRGLSRHVSAAQWQQITAGMAAAFRQGDYEGGLNAAVDTVCELLSRHFPLSGLEANPNELPDAPVVQ